MKVFPGETIRLTSTGPCKVIAQDADTGRITLESEKGTIITLEEIELTELIVDQRNREMEAETERMRRELDDDG